MKIQEIRDLADSLQMNINSYKSSANETEMKNELERVQNAAALLSKAPLTNKPSGLIFKVNSLLEQASSIGTNL